MPRDFDSVKALVFDVGGTVFDWRGSIRQEVQALAKERSVDCDTSAFAVDWRRRMFVLLERMRGGELARTNADGLHRLALDEILPDYPDLELTPADRDQLNEVWHHLKVWPDFPDVLMELKRRRRVIVLSVLSWAIVVDSSKERGLLWDGILSCEFLGHYKPDHEAYLGAIRLLRLHPEEAMMVAAHPGDLRAAAEVGYRTAFVARHEMSGPHGSVDSGAFSGAASHEGPFDISVDDFAKLGVELS